MQGLLFKLTLCATPLAETVSLRQNHTRGMRKTILGDSLEGLSSALSCNLRRVCMYINPVSSNLVDGEYRAHRARYYRHPSSDKVDAVLPALSDLYELFGRGPELERRVIPRKNEG